MACAGLGFHVVRESLHDGLELPAAVSPHTLTSTITLVRVVTVRWHSEPDDSEVREMDTVRPASSTTTPPNW